MAGYSSRGALIFICTAVCLSCLGDCIRIVVGEREQNVHLVLPSEKEESEGISGETQAFKGDGKFEEERSRGLRFGCHHGRFKRWGHGMNEHMRFHPRPQQFWHLRQDKAFDCDFPKGHRHGHDHDHGHGHEYWHEFGHGHGYKGRDKEEQQSDVKAKWIKME